MHWPNLDQLSPHDEVKFVIEDRADFDYACESSRRHHLASRRAPCCSLRSTGCCRPPNWPSWIIDATLPARLQIQTHKYIWRPETQRSLAESACRGVGERGSKSHGEPETSRIAGRSSCLSGGLDSATAAALARREGWALHGLTFATARCTRARLDAARRSPPHSASSSTSNSTSTSGSSADPHSSGTASSPNSPVPQLSSFSSPTRSAPDSDHVPSTYVPARNTVFLSLALAWAEALEPSRIVIGVNALDYSGYPDCRPEFIAAFEYLATLATRAGLEGHAPRIWAPLQHLSKAAIIRAGLELGVDYGLTHSCYNPGPAGEPCAQCDSCRIARARIRRGRHGRSPVVTARLSTHNSAPLWPAPFVEQFAARHVPAAGTRSAASWCLPRVRYSRPRSTWSTRRHRDVRPTVAAYMDADGTGGRGEAWGISGRLPLPPGSGAPDRWTPTGARFLIAYVRRGRRDRRPAIPARRRQ